MTQEVHPGPSSFLRPTVTYLHPDSEILSDKGNSVNLFG